jgi:Zn-dependent M28 family amino/carboxypeptidase
MDPVLSRRGEPVPGANDGGSGVAVLLEVAELLHLRAPAVGVELVFLDGEDLGRPEAPDDYCRGSKGYARRLPPRSDAARPVAGFVFDMVGDRDLGIWDEGVFGLPRDEPGGVGSTKRPAQHGRVTSTRACGTH